MTKMIDRLFKAVPDGAIYRNYVALIVDLMVVWSVD